MLKTVGLDYYTFCVRNASAAWNKAELCAASNCPAEPYRTLPHGVKERMWFLLKALIVCIRFGTHRKTSSNLWFQAWNQTSTEPWKAPGSGAALGVGNVALSHSPDVETERFACLVWIRGDLASKQQSQARSVLTVFLLIEHVSRCSSN